MEMYHQTVKMQKDRVSETLNLEYEPGIGDNMSDDFTTGSYLERLVQ